MKKFILVCLALLAVSVAKAQDVIVTRDTFEVQGKVQEITADKILYVPVDSPDGKVRVMPKAYVSYIKYQDGHTEVIPMNDRQRASAGMRITGVRLQSYAYLGTTFRSAAGGATVDLSLGARVYDYFYAGVETGFHTLFYVNHDKGKPDEGLYHNRDAEGYVPLALNLKGYIPAGRRIYPHLNCSLGGFFGVMDLHGRNGFYLQAGAGVDVRRFSLGIGYTRVDGRYHDIDCGYIKLGVRIGKW